MKFTVVTPQGRFTVEPATTKQGVQVKFKPLVWPEVGMVLTPLEAAALADAFEFCAVKAESVA